jgi:hypothetical protein
MASYAAGVTATWRGTAIGEITELKVTHGGSLPIGRSTPYSFDAGTIEVSSLSTASMSFAEYGLKGTLAFGGGGVNVTTKAICQTLTLAAKVQDVWRYSSTYKIVKE